MLACRLVPRNADYTKIEDKVRSVSLYATTLNIKLHSVSLIYIENSVTFAWTPNVDEDMYTPVIFYMEYSIKGVVESSRKI